MQNWKTILKNFISLSGGELLSKGIAFVTTIYLARIILPEGFGILGYTTAFVSYFILFVDFGFSVISIKKIANNPKVIPIYVNNIISFRILLSAVLFILLIVLVLFLNESEIIKYALIINGFGIFVNAISVDFLFQAVEKFKYIVIKNVTVSILTLLLVLLFVKTNSDTLITLTIYLSANFFLTLWLFTKYQKKYYKYFWEIRPKFIKTLISNSYPIVISMFMATIFNNIDMLFLGMLKTETEVGFYSAAYKVFLVTVIPLNILLRVFLPSLSKTDNKAQLKKIISVFISVMFSISLVMMFGMFLFSSEIICFIFGENYYNSIIPLQILSLNGLVVSANIAFGNPLTVWGKQKQHSIAFSIGAFTNIILNFVLIPKYSIIGASFATLLSEGVVFIGIIFPFSSYLTKNKIYD